MIRRLLRLFRQKPPLRVVSLREIRELKYRGRLVLLRKFDLQKVMQTYRNNLTKNDDSTKRDADND